METSALALPVVMDPPEPPLPPAPPMPAETLPPVPLLEPLTLAEPPLPPMPATPPVEVLLPVLEETETELLTVALPPLVTEIDCANAAGAPKSVSESIAISEVIFFMVIYVC